MNAVPPPTRPSVASISSANYRRQSSLELFDGSQKTSVRLTQSIQSAATDEIANGVINDPTKKPPAVLSTSVDKPVCNIFIPNAQASDALIFAGKTTIHLFLITYNERFSLRSFLRWQDWYRSYFQESSQAIDLLGAVLRSEPTSLLMGLSILNFSSA